jgi:hypothetical protein
MSVFPSKNGAGADQVVDLTDPRSPAQSVEILTPAGIVRVHANTVVVRTGQQRVVVEIEANHARRPLTGGGGIWDLTTNHTARGIVARLTRREGS